MPADLVLPDNIAVRCSLTISRPGRVSGRSTDLGIRIASYNPPFNLNRGQAYWSGEFELAPTDRGNEEQRGIIEATVVSYLHGNRTVKIPISRSSILDITGALVTDSTGEKLVSSSAKVILKKGAYFTIDDKLYMFIGENKDVKSTQSAQKIEPNDTFPPYDKSKTINKSVEYQNPYLLGVLPQDATVLLDREGTFAGPWVFPFVSA